MSAGTALLVGATGLVGRHCLERLLSTPRYTRVDVLVRRSLGRAEPKLAERVIDFDALASMAAELAGPLAAEDVYCCLGTTLKSAGSEEAFRRVDHGYVVEVARLARAGGARRFALVSSVGASPRALSFYLRTKGEAERDVSALGYETVEIMRPSFLLGERGERRSAEALAGALTRRLSPLLVGRLRGYRPIEAATVADAMVAALGRSLPGVHVREHDEIVQLAREVR